ncbi:hypothetical protein A8C56_02860 [Niabella ginsenosidivorans]|uniref:RDD domain-containing protein n=1 Tax=Niabella ginsenosidivorans TaxID=1176587 RepID=A0A1A9I0I3_9BACT|nr:RDD family protein [Niabella ginsenosidivorans]ANH80064.1 hypothetical protein A8C56_02860 [Niabella ginsenosidivorans]
MSKYHTFWRRLAAAIIDGIILFPLTFLYNTSNGYFYIGIIAESVLSILYFVVLQGKYGQTLGKKIMSIKIFDITETKPIGFKKAILREFPWIIITMAALVYLFFILFVYRTDNTNTALEKYNNLSFYISLSWIEIELVTMFTNNKRRALHDWLAKSVVIKINIAS